MRLAVLKFMLLLTFAGSDLVLNSVVLSDPALFSTLQFETVLSTFSDSAKVLSVSSDLITGSIARRSYFPNNTDIHFFQLVHITRVQALLRTSNDAYTSSQLHRSLGPACLAAGIGAVAIDSNAAIVSSPNVVMDWIAGIPPLAVILMAAGWFLTAASCAVCWLVYCCCRTHRETIPAAVVVAPPPQSLESQQPDLPLSFRPGTPRLVMRLPVEMTRPQFAGQYGPCAGPTSFEGPSAARSGSWHQGPATARP